MTTTTIFSNVMNIRLTQSELVLEFGSFFPEGPRPTAPPSDYKPDARVVMNISAAQALMAALTQALAQRQGAAVQPGPKPTPGFNT